MWPLSENRLRLETENVAPLSVSYHTSDIAPPPVNVLCIPSAILSGWCNCWHSHRFSSQTSFFYGCCDRDQVSRAQCIVTCQRHTEPHKAAVASRAYYSVVLKGLGKKKEENVVWSPRQPMSRASPVVLCGRDHISAFSATLVRAYLLPFSWCVYFRMCQLWEF